jgi:translation initiation factor IF-3
LSQEKVRINQAIRAAELRVIGPAGENFGVINISEALRKAEEFGLDLIEISPDTNPPIAKIMDFGKYQYETNKREKISRHRTKTAEIKSTQIKVGTGEHDLALKAKKVSEWLTDGHRVRIELFLSGRSKYMDDKFLRGRLERILRLISVSYKVSDPIKRGPKGITVVVDKN